MEKDADPLLKLLQRFQQEGVKYILVGGHAVRLNGFLRSTEDIDILLPSSIANGEHVIKALDFLPSAAELRAEWFDPGAEEPENIRIADEILIDLLFAANGETFESLQPHVRILNVDGVDITTLDIEGLLKTKTVHREKDMLDRQVLSRILERLQGR